MIFKEFHKIDGQIKEITDETKVGWERFVNIFHEVEPETEGHQEMLTKEELEEIVKSSIYKD